MRWLLTLLALPVLADTNFFLKFDYLNPAPSNVVVRYYYSTNIDMPLTNWSVVATNTLVTGTNSSSDKLTLSSTTPNFFIISVSNEWGEVFSDVLGSWPLTGDGIKIRLSK
jgi:hypothetical protein